MIQTDGEIYHVLGLEESTFENDYTTQCNIQIKCNLYQTTNGIFNRNRIKHLGINLTKETKDLYAENYNTDERN